MKLNPKDPTPLYQQIALDIKQKITNNELNVGDRLDPHKVLAKNYDVSLITIKKALSDLVAQGILYGRVGKGTFVAKKTIPLVTSKKPKIGMVLREINNPFFSLIAESIENEAYKHGYNILLSHSSNQADKEEHQIQQFLELNVDGLVIASMSHVYQKTPTIEKLHSDGFPYVMVSYVNNKDVYYVGTDHEKGGYIAAEHFINLGYKSIGYINAENGNPIGELRKNGFIRALNENDIEFNTDFEYRLQYRGDWDDYFAGYDIGEKFSKLKKRPEALFVYKDLSALGFQRALLNQGLKLPEDVALIGFDDIKRGVVAPVPLTTIHQPTNQIGILAFEKLTKQINREPISDIYTVLEPTLIIRNSCGSKSSKFKLNKQYLSGSL